MPRKILNLDLDFMSINNFKRFSVKQLDDVLFRIRPLMNKTLIDTTNSTCEVYIASGNDVFMQKDNIETGSEYITVSLDRNMLQKKGVAMCEIVLKDEIYGIASMNFVFGIEGKISEGATIPGNIEGFVEKYEKLISEFRKKVDEAIEGIDGKVENVISDLQEDYDSLKKVIIDENVSANLQNQINNIIVPVSNTEIEINPSVFNEVMV